ncbi:hypothetical protein D3C75_1295300 [compost metagenome]
MVMLAVMLERIDHWATMATPSTAKKEDASTTSREKSSPHTPARISRVAQPSRKWNTCST